MKYLLYFSERNSSYSFFNADSDTNAQIIESDAELIWSVEAKSYEIACLKQHKFLGWEPYKPYVSDISDLRKLLPEDKFDIDNAELLINLGFPTIKPVMNEFMNWTQDANWPVSQIIYPFMIELDTEITQYIDKILKTDDEEWKLVIMKLIVQKLSLDAKLELQKLLRE